MSAPPPPSHPWGPAIDLLSSIAPARRSTRYPTCIGPGGVYPKAQDCEWECGCILLHVSGPLTHAPPLDKHTSSAVCVRSTFAHLHTFAQSLGSIAAAARPSAVRRPALTCAYPWSRSDLQLSERVDLCKLSVTHWQLPMAASTIIQIVAITPPGALIVLTSFSLENALTSMLVTSSREKSPRKRPH